MPRSHKIVRVLELKERIESSDALLLTEYRGLTVAEITALRRSLSEGGAGFAVVKNTLMRRAADDAALEELGSLLEGPTAVAFVRGDAVAAAKKVVDAQRKYPTLILKGAYMDGRLLSAAEARSLADLESREVMLSKIAGLLKGEMSRAAAVMRSAQSKFVGILNAYREKVPGETEEEGVAEAVANAEPPDVSAAEADTVEETSGAQASDEQGEE